MNNKDRMFYLNILRGDECQCGRPKYTRKALCITCYRQLPQEMQNALYKGICYGFEEAYEEAVKFLTS